mmetsp:Transcript_31520/g.67703  ORF Transcript_31520/g.67703 Transcript_31520/m.67703 type:complete len:93 (+) Transcript_31520:2792-3070(+)
MDDICESLSNSSIQMFATELSPRCGFIEQCRHCLGQGWTSNDDTANTVTPKTHTKCKYYTQTHAHVHLHEGTKPPRKGDALLMLCFEMQTIA